MFVFFIRFCDVLSNSWDYFVFRVGWRCRFRLCCQENHTRWAKSDAAVFWFSSGCQCRIETFVWGHTKSSWSILTKFESTLVLLDHLVAYGSGEVGVFGCNAMWGWVGSNLSWKSLCVKSFSRPYQNWDQSEAQKMKKWKNLNIFCPKCILVLRLQCWGRDATQILTVMLRADPSQRRKS